MRHLWFSPTLSFTDEETEAQRRVLKAVCPVRRKQGQLEESQVVLLHQLFLHKLWWGGEREGRVNYPQSLEPAVPFGLGSGLGIHLEWRPHILL